MRSTIFSLIAASVFTLLTQAAFSFEIEEEIYFKVSNPTSELRIISAADTLLFTPIIKAFQQKHTQTEITYTAVSSTQLMQAVVTESIPYDIAISSAMDLQTKLANDGFTRKHISSATKLIPDWGKWRNSIFAFTQEPATLVISTKAFEGLNIPTSRQELIDILRENPDRFMGRVGTYDIRNSGLGYLFATQDSRTSETFWRLSEVMGRLNVKLYCCSSKMIEDVSTGKIAVAYNVLGSYASARKDLADSIQIIAPRDFTTLMLRSAVVLKTETDTDMSNKFLDFLLVSAWGENKNLKFPFPNKQNVITENTISSRPIRFGPGLLVFIDVLKRNRFINEWEDAMVQ